LPSAWHVFDQLRQQVERRGVDPLQVLDYDEEGLIVSAHERDRDQRVNGQLPLAIRRQVERRIATLELHRQQPGHQGPHGREVETVLREKAVQLVEALLGVVQPEL